MELNCFLCGDSYDCPQKLFAHLNNYGPKSHLYDKLKGKQKKKYISYKYISNCYFFLDEGITIDDLHMLKTHHIEKLLTNFSILDQAKFEFTAFSYSFFSSCFEKLFHDFLYIYIFLYSQINIDFSLKFPLARSIHNKWRRHKEQIFITIKSKIQNAHISRQLQELENKNTGKMNHYKKTYIFILIIILILCFCRVAKFHHFLVASPRFSTTPKSFNRAQRIKNSQKHTISDSQEGFVTMASSKEELEMKLKLLKLQCRNIQPKLLLIGNFCLHR